MQRKNNILSTLKLTRRRRYYKYIRNSKKNGFAMIMAIAALVVISGIMAISISLSTKTAKRTTDLYLYEQAVLYSKSAAEYALLQIAAAPACTIGGINTTFGANQIGSQNNIYNVDIKLRYIFADTATCNLGGAVQYIKINSPEQNGSVLMDITVTVDDSTIVNEPIRYFRRTIQKL